MAVETLEGLLHDLALLRSEQANWRIMLFKNDYTPDSDTVLADLIECDYSGYGRLTPVSAPPEEGDDDDAEMVAGTVTFTHSGGGVGNTVYGWALIDTEEEITKAVERFAAPRSMAASGDMIAVTLTSTLDGE